MGDAAEPIAPDRQVLDRALARGVMWIGISKWATQLLSWAATLVVARLLSPEDFGVFGMAAMFLGGVTLLSEFGIDAAVVNLRHLSEPVLRQLNAVAVLLGFAAFGLGCALAPLLGAFFGAPELPAVIVAMSTNFVVLGMRVVPQAMLQRRLRFHGIAIAESCQAILVSAGAIILAWMGFRYWTLVISSVAGTVISTMLVLFQSRVGFGRPVWPEVRSAVQFSRDTIVARMAWYGYDNSDFLVAGRLLGKEQLGAYAIGWQLATATVEKITSLIGRVTPGVLAAASGDRAGLRRYLLGVTETIALVTIPATIGLALVAPDLIPLVLGSKWEAAILPLQLLALYASFRSLAPFLAQMLVATGQTGRAAKISLAGLVVLPIAFLIGSQWGLAGIAAAWLVAHPLTVLIPEARYAFRAIDLAARDYLRALLPAATGTVVMALGVLGIQWFPPFPRGTIAMLALEVSVGVLMFSLAVLLRYPERVRRILQFLRQHLGRVRAA